MKPTIYIETSLIGYLTSRMSRDLITAGNQKLTQEWWAEHRHNYEMFISQFVLDECRVGDVQAARERLDVLTGLKQLDISEAALTLAERLIDGVPLPEKAEVDSAHIAVAAFHGIEYRLTWNCKHIANATFRPRIEAICRSGGYEPPIICTPQELMEDL